MLKSSFATIGAVPPILKFEKAYYFYDDNGGLYILMKEDENNHAHEAKLFRENLKKHGFIDKGNLLHSKKYGFDVQIDGYASLLFVTFIFPDDNNDIED